MLIALKTVEFYDYKQFRTAKRKILQDDEYLFDLFDYDFWFFVDTKDPRLGELVAFQVTKTPEGT